MFIHTPKETHENNEQVEVPSHLLLIRIDRTQKDFWPSISLVFSHAMTLGLSMPMSLELS